MAANFVSKEGDKFYMVRCPVCNRENYALAVSSGQCAWCGITADEAYAKCEAGDSQYTFMKMTREDLMTWLVSKAPKNGEVE